jgi:sigma-B regulation protein RsbU (phosphoserine phosphatase)
MKIMVAENDPISRRLFEATLLKCGYEVAVARDGLQAWEMLQSSYAPRLALIDRMMQGLDGLELCRKARGFLSNLPPYIILVTTRDRREDIVEGFQNGADDYLLKPFDPEELKARIRAAERIIELQRLLAKRQLELESALARNKRFHRLIPICVYCGRMKDGRDYWREVEAFVSSHSDSRISRGVCPECDAKVLAEKAQDAKPA